LKSGQGGTCWLLFLLCLGSWIPGTVGACADGYDVQLRILWGGPTNRSYSGSIAIQDGYAKALNPVSMQADSAHTVLLKDNRTIEILPTSPTRYGGTELQVIGSEKTRIRISVSDPAQGNNKQAPRVIDMTLADLLQQSRSLALDNAGSSLLVERPPADKLRVAFQRSSLIFAPEDAIPLSVIGQHLGLGANQSLKLTFTLISEATGTALHSTTTGVTTDDTGSFAETSPETLYAPSQEGVYRVDIRAEPRRVLGSLLSDSGVNRSLQFVVLSPDSPPANESPWKSIDSWEPAPDDVIIDSANNSGNNPATAERNRWLNWRSLGTRNSWWNGSPRQSARSPVTQNANERGETLLRPSDWYLVPLKIQAAGQPHRLVIRYLSDQPLHLGLTILEPNGEGVLSPLGVNSGAELSSDDLREVQGSGETEIVFWPKSTTASLLVTNPDAENSVRLIGYELFSGPEHLESHQASANKATEPAPRMAAIYLDKPLLAEYFGGAEVVDPATGRGLHAWQSYYAACQHLVEYIKWSGHNGVILYVAGEGGSLYPSEAMRSNPKFDRGRFFTDGRDPIQKDVVELLLRMLDREGLQILLGVHFDGAMDPSLYRADDDSEPLELVDINRRPWSLPNPTAQRAVPRFNPLNPVVQDRITRTLTELAQRYGKHSSLRGVVVEMGGSGHLSFAGDRWGYDAATLQAFSRSLNAQVPTDLNELTQFVQSRMRSIFMQWRAKQLTLFMQQLAQRIQRERPDLRLVVTTAGLAKHPPVESDFVEWSELWMPPEYISISRGLDLQELKQIPEIDVLQADVRYPLHSLPQQRWSYGVRDLPVTKSPTQSDHLRGGSLLLLPPSSRNWPAVEKQQPLGIATAKVWTFHQVTPQSSSARSTWCDHLLADDGWLIASGGWSPNFGSENWLREAASRWTQLPPVRFEDADASTETQLSRSVAVRTARYDNKTYLLLINASPWSEVCGLEWNKQPARNHVRLVSTTPLDVPDAWYLSKLWTITLKPYEWQTICIDDPQLSISRWAHEPEEKAIEIAKAKLNDLSERVKRLHTTRLAPLDSLINGDFESFGADGKPMGWTYSTLPSTKISPSTAPYRGNSCVRLENESGSNAPLWLQSSPLRLPKTGRMAVELWIRKEPGSEEPKVRLTLQGRQSDGSRYERSQLLGRGSGDAPISERWETAPLVLLVSDLPTSGIEDLRVEIDLLGGGTIYVDEVKVYGVYLHPDERNLIRNEIFAASEPFRDPALTVRLDEIERLWKSYWGEYLRRYVPLTSNLSVVREATPDAAQSARPAGELSQDPKPKTNGPSNSNSNAGRSAAAQPESANPPTTSGPLRRRLGNLRGSGSSVDR
jgi:hypothetical protein